MATDSPSTGDTFKVFHAGEWHELIVRTRQSHAGAKAEQLAQLTIKTIGLWLRVWQAYKQDTWQLDGDSPEQTIGVESGDYEPFVTVFNKTFTGISLTVHSSSKGQAALNTLMAVLFARDDIAEKMPKLFSPDTQQQAPANPPKPAKTGQKRNIDDVDSFLNDSATHGVMPPATEAPQAASGEKLPFRFFKRIAPNVIQLQEFKKGGGETYTKSAIEATLPFHKDNPQYDENSLVYYPITGAIQIKEGKFGNQAIIPTAKGRIYIDAEYNGQEKPEWATLSTDLYDQYERLMHDENAQLFAPDCVLVLKNSALTHSAKKNANVQWKNFYHIYQPLKD